MAGIAFHHLIGWLKAGIGDFTHGELLMALHQQGGETRTGATSKAVENEEALEPSALVYKHRPGNVLPSSSLTEEGVEGIISTSDCLVTGHLSVWLDPMLQTVELPAGIANLDTGLTDVDGDTLTLGKTNT
ncbi:hypothetical protein CRUP_038786 [Coryphaenoides rupestris]|nr:hypothetical protein CRUP_038786 [Coryphaenoides rupestris]